MIHEKNKRGLPFKLTIISLTGCLFSLNSQSHLSFKWIALSHLRKKNYLGLINQDKLEDGFQRNLVWFPNVGDHKYTLGPFITSKDFGVFKLISSVPGI